MVNAHLALQIIAVSCCLLSNISLLFVNAERPVTYRQAWKVFVVSRHQVIEIASSHVIVSLTLKKNMTRQKTCSGTWQPRIRAGGLWNWREQWSC